MFVWTTRSGPRRMLPPVYFVGTLLLMVFLHRYLPIRRLAEWPVTGAGLALVAAGLLLAFGTARAFPRAGTTVRPFEESTVLLQHGPYRFSRNPIYLGLVLITVGVALRMGTASPWLPIFPFIAVLEYRFVRMEERMLDATFGEAYRQYRGRVRRWL